jgi:hypothetical protein
MTFTALPSASVIHEASELLDAFVLVVASEVVFVGFAFLVCEHGDAAGLQHPHHHAGAAAGEPRYHCDQGVSSVYLCGVSIKTCRGFMG